MKPTEEISANELQLELKYCERCGGLWLRPVGAAQVYCAHCEPEMSELPAPARKRPRMPGGPRWSRNTGGSRKYGSADLEAVGGVA